ncbi:muconate/chloromuconate family cycloisomerase [Phaeobacter inhibens]|uniref:Mandelate racemase / muconate lactonizing enzyme n=1 Tax=Phaeobacter inhibens TaxID=221822 RepID=A0A2I7KGD8_9RHOB|nr:muconate/chloromuconate family cycloisomerase [Phaeobacter inhibens]AUR01631.1 mandelate racemase / muconate lactonizing enzyme [Phaeobacter inhibens]
MIKIDAIDTQIIDLPTIRGHVLSMATMTEQSVVLVEVLFSDGSTGIGEGTAIGGLSYGAESPESIQSAIETYIAPAIIGMDGDAVNAARLRAQKAVVGNPIARCAVENALWDGLGKRLGLPISTLMGGAVHTGLEVAWTLASGDSDKDIAEALEMLERRRHRQFKLKVGKRAVRDDLAHVGKIKAALGDKAVITVDVNQAWDMHSARWGLKGLQDIGVAMVEQPIPAVQRSGLSMLSKSYEIAVMADEALRGPEDALNHARCHAADAFAVKIAQSGGLSPASEVIAIGKAAGLGLYAGTMLESGVGTAAALQLFSTVETLQWGTELFGPLLFKDDILTTPLRYADFQVHLPEGPGCGVTLDQDKIKFYRRGAPRQTPVKVSV